MPGKVKVKIISGRNLPVMDRSSDTTDAYVEIKLGNTTYKTDVCRKSLHPQWNSEWYRFEVDDSELQDEPLQIRLMDHDTYSANDAIGKVYLDLNPLLLPAANVLLKYCWNGETSTNSDNSCNSVMSGWIPVYDTMHGIRGEVNIIVKVELFTDFNKFRQSSCGVQFFCSSTIPHGYYIQAVHGFVEELVVNDDPEYQWIDKIRTPRASNEARQTLFFKLSGELQRKIGVKALDLGANAVLGYNQCFDLEGESGIVARGIGTAVTLIKILDAPQLVSENPANEERVLSYLNFLGFDKTFHLNESCNLKNLYNLFPRPVSLQSADSAPNIGLISNKKQLIRHLSHTDFNKPHMAVIHHSASLQTLLKQEDMRGIPAYGISKRIKNLKYTSQNILSKKMIAIKAKLSDTSDDQGLPTELVEIKKQRPFKVSQTSSNDLSVMAELLVRSVIQAHSSLDCIAEAHDTSHPQSYECDTLEQMQPLEDFIKSISDASSSSESSSSDDEENLSENKDLHIEYDTVSNIVKTVEMIERKLSFENSFEESNDNEDLSANSSINKEIKIGEDLEIAVAINISDDLASISKAEQIPLDGCFVAETAKEEPSLSAENCLSSEAFCEKLPVTISSTSSFSEFGGSSNNKNFDLAQSVTFDCPETENINISRGKCFEEGEHILMSKNKSDDDVKPAKYKNKLKWNKSYHFFKKPLNIIRKHGASIKDKRISLKNLFYKQKEETNSLAEKKDLLGAALGNMVAETVQDVLATSHSNNPKLPKSLPYSLILTTNINSPLINTEIDESSNSCYNNLKLHASLTPSLRHEESPVQDQQNKEQGHQPTESISSTKIARSPAKLNEVPCIHRRSSDSDLSITPKGNSLTGSDRSGGILPSHCLRTNQLLRPTLHHDNFDMLEYPFLTMSKYPPGFITYLGGAVSARSVKLLERITNIEEPESRDMWWSEIRLEIRSHARALNCNAVLGYVESTSICEDVCVLSASGTAAIIGFNRTCEAGDSVGSLPVIQKSQIPSKDIMTSSLDRSDFEKENTQQKPCDSTAPNTNKLTESPDNEGTVLTSNNLSCAICHLPYNSNTIPIRITTSKCAKCRMDKVPDVLIATVEVPDGIPSIGRGCFIQSYVCRPLKDTRGESNAKEISDGLPFLEYELHRLLVNKLKIKGMNAIFGLKVRITVGEKLLIGVATGTAVFLSPLPVPQIPKLVSDRSLSEKKLLDLQKHLNETVKRNREIYQIKISDDVQNGRVFSDDESEDEQPVLDLSVGNKECCILEVDDPEDFEILKIIMDVQPPDGFHVVNTQHVPGLEELEIVKNLQMFTQIWRVKIHHRYKLDKYFHRLLQSVYFKLRRMIPCALCDLQFHVDLPEPDELQLCIVGMALGLGDSQKQNSKYKRKNTTIRKNEDELIFNLEDDQIPENSVASTLPTANQLHAQTLKFRQKSPQRRFFAVKQKHVPHRERYGVDITPLSYIPGGKIERYLGNLNFFFIRETTSIREEGGLSGFLHSFMTEVLAIVRAHITALGGNAMVAYFMTECILNHSLHKNQGQCLINVGGDVVFVSYFNEEQ